MSDINELYSDMEFLEKIIIGIGEVSQITGIPVRQIFQDLSHRSISIASYSKKQLVRISYNKIYWSIECCIKYRYILNILFLIVIFVDISIFIYKTI